MKRFAICLIAIAFLMGCALAPTPDNTEYQEYYQYKHRYEYPSGWAYKAWQREVGQPGPPLRLER
jgi:hypothetical protein